MEKIDAEPDRAIYALSVAAEQLVQAKEKMDDSQFDEAISLSKDSMRIAASAILFRDGLVCEDFESSYVYLEKTYGDKIPASDWKEAETISKSGTSFLGGLFGMGKKNNEKNARKAIDSAVRFFDASNTIITR